MSDGMKIVGELEQRCSSAPLGTWVSVINPQEVAAALRALLAQSTPPPDFDAKLYCYPACPHCGRELVAQSTPPPREPTEAMLDAGRAAVVRGAMTYREEAAATWRAMYDAAPDSATREPEGT
jgi:hypothetical protein